MPGRLAVIRVGLLAASAAAALAMRRSYGSRAGAPFAAGLVLATLAQQSLVGIAAAPESVLIVREFPLKIPAGAQFFVRLGLVKKPAGPDQP